MSSHLQVATVGVHGHGNKHVVEALRLQASGSVKLVSTVDPKGPVEGLDLPHFESLHELLDTNVPDIVVLSTPIHSHFELASLALRAGAHVLLEKPPVTSVEEFIRLGEVAKQVDRNVQVGFQSLGSHGIKDIIRRIEEGEIGDVLSYSATGTWVRNLKYWHRAAWAGKRYLDGLPVVDGVVTNPLAHATATLLNIADSGRLGEISEIELDQYRVNDIETDDTSVLKFRTKSGLPVTVALTLCAKEQSHPAVTIWGAAGKIDYYYTLDTAIVQDDLTGYKRVLTYERESLMENLVQNLRGEAELLVPLESTGAFTSILETVRTAPTPERIPSEFVTWVGEGEEAHPVLHDIELYLSRAAKMSQTFQELKVPWAV